MELQERLQQKQREAATRALLDAIVEDPRQSISTVMTSLEADDDASFFSEVFKELSLGQIWFATLSAIVEGRIPTSLLQESIGDEDGLQDRLSALVGGMSKEPEGRSNGSVSAVEEAIITSFATSTAGGSSDEEDNEYADASDDVEDELPATGPRKAKGKSKGKGKGKKAKGKGKGKKAKAKDKDKAKKAPPKAKPKAASSDEALDLSDDKMRRAYRKSIMDYLKANKCTDYESGAPAQKVREVVGGSPKQLRDELAQMIGDEMVSYDGVARGTRYFVA